MPKFNPMGFQWERLPGPPPAPEAPRAGSPAAGKARLAVSLAVVGFLVVMFTIVGLVFASVGSVFCATAAR